MKDTADALRNELSEVENELSSLRAREHEQRRQAEDLRHALENEIARGEETTQLLGQTEADLDAKRAEVQVRQGLG